MSSIQYSHVAILSLIIPIKFLCKKRVYTEEFQSGQPYKADIVTEAKVKSIKASL